MIVKFSLLHSLFPKCLFQTKVTDGVVAADKEGKQFEIPADSVILCTGYKSAPLAPKAKNVHVIGDAAKVGNLRSVIWGAWDICMKL